MPKYLKIAPDPDAKPCRCGDGSPDCEHFEFCPECGEEYKAHEGHDCLDGFAVAQVGTAKELRDAAKELRDSLDACETERDRLRAQIAALQSVPQGVEVPEIPVDVLSSIEQAHSCEEWDWRAPAITAWFRRNARNPAVRVEVPPYPDVLVRQSIGHTERHAGIMEGVEWARKNARIVPTPPHPLHPEERRVGPDEVVVGMEEWEAIEQILKASAICATEVGTDRRCCVQTDDHYIPLTRLRAIRALRTSAQAHNGEEAK